MKTYIIILILLCASYYCDAQKYFNKVCDNNSNIEGFNDAIQIADTGYITAGTSKTFGVGYNYYVLRTDKKGNKTHETYITIPRTEIVINSIKKIDDSTLIACALIMDQDSTTLRYNRDILLIKMTNNGDTVWTKRFGLAIGTALNPDLETANSIIITNDKCYVMVGFTSNTPGNNNQIYLIKTDSLGNLLWQKTYGGAAADNAYSLLQTPDKGFLLAGYTYSYGNGDRDGYLIKTDSTGNFQWQKTYGGGGNDGLVGLCRAMDGSGYFLSGWYNFDLSNSSYDKPWLIKVNNSGTVIWDKMYGGNKVSGLLKGALQLADSSIAMFGSIQDTLGMPISALLMKTTANGDSLWARKYKRATTMDDYFWNFSPTYDGGFIIAGQVPGQATPSGTQDGWLVKVDCMGADSITHYFGDTCYTNPIGIKEESKTQEPRLKIYPNPATDMLNIELTNLLTSQPSNLQTTITLENVVGQVVYTTKTNQQTNKINISTLVSGIYLVKVYNKQQLIETKKIIKE